MTDLAPLARLQGLQTLDLSSTGVTDLAPLAGLQGLQRLELWGTGVTDLVPLASLQGLQSLYISSTGLLEAPAVHQVRIDLGVQGCGGQVGIEVRVDQREPLLDAGEALV